MRVRLDYGKTGLWADLPEDGREAILEQARYVAALLPHLKDEEED